MFDFSIAGSSLGLHRGKGPYIYNEFMELPNGRDGYYYYHYYDHDDDENDDDGDDVDDMIAMKSLLTRLRQTLALNAMLRT